MMWIPTGLLTDHWATLVSQKDNSPAKGDRVAMVLIPLAAGVAASIWPPDHITVLVDATAVLTALLFGLVVHVFSLGLSASGNALVEGTWVMKLIDQLVTNVSYAIAVGVIAVVLLGASGAYQNDYPWMEHGVGGAGVAALLHLLMTLGMVLKRLRTAYREMRRLAREASHL